MIAVLGIFAAAAVFLRVAERLNIGLLPTAAAMLSAVTAWSYKSLHSRTPQAPPEVAGAMMSRRAADAATLIPDGVLTMYVPKSFEESRTDVLHGLIRERPFGTLVVLTDHGLNVNHLPFIVDDSANPFGVLRGHVARANPVWRTKLHDADAVAVFQAKGPVV